MTPRSSAGTLLAVAGMGALCAGFRLGGLALFAAGCQQLERDWRRRHPEFDGGLDERWRRALEFYDSTHRHPKNRRLHVIGIPMIAAGAAGLFASRPFSPVTGPLWLGSLTLFGTGWALNLVGHAAYEKAAPAFSEDALSFIAGPAWDAQQLVQKMRRFVR